MDGFGTNELELSMMKMRPLNVERHVVAASNRKSDGMRGQDKATGK